MRLPRRCVPCNDRGMDSRFRENDPSEARFHGASIKGNGNTKEVCPIFTIEFFG